MSKTVKKNMPRAVIVGVNRPEDQARYMTELDGFDVRFPISHSEAVALLTKTTVLAVSLDQKTLLTKAGDRGFRGHIIPIMTGKQQEFVPAKGKRIPAIACRHAPGEILKHLKRAAAQ